MPPRVKKPNNPAPDDPGWIHYVEPYFGGGSVLFANDPTGISEVANDLDGELTNWWHVLQKRELREELIPRLQLQPVSQNDFDAAVLARGSSGVFGDVERAAQFFIRNRQSRQGLETDFNTMTRNRTRRGMNEQVSAWLSAIDGLQWHAERLMRVVIFNVPALQLIRQQDGKRTLYYADPPYWLGSRGKAAAEYGEFEMKPGDHAFCAKDWSCDRYTSPPPDTELQRIGLLDQLLMITGRFMLSGYHSPLYDSWAEHAGIKCHEYLIDNKASSAKEKEQKTECVWCNF